MSQKPKPAPAKPTELHVLCEQPDGCVSTLRDGRKAQWTPEKAIHRLPIDSAWDLVRMGARFVPLFTVEALALRYKVPVAAVEALIAAGVAAVHEHKDADAPEGSKPSLLVALTHAVGRELVKGIKARAKEELRQLRERLKNPTPSTPQVEAGQ